MIGRARTRDQAESGSVGGQRGISGATQQGRVADLTLWTAGPDPVWSVRREGGGSGGLEEHPEGHGHHHEVLGQGDEAEGDAAVTADAGALEVAFFEVDGFEDGDGSNGADEEGGGRGEPGGDAGEHEDAGAGFDEGVEVGVGDVALGDEVVLDEAGGEGEEVLEFEDAEHAHAQGDEVLKHGDRGEGAECDPVGGEGEGKGDGEDGKDGLVGGALLGIGAFAEVFAELVVAAEVFAFEKDLRGLVVAVFLLIGGVGFVALEVVVVDLVAGALEQVERLDAPRTEVVGGDHAVEGGSGAGLAHVGSGGGEFSRGSFPFSVVEPGAELTSGAGCGRGQ